MWTESSYETWFREEERKLRWLIERLPTSLELRYYLVFSLLANNQYAKALEECRSILELTPDNVMARWWASALEGRRSSDPLHHSPWRRRRMARGHTWRQCGSEDS